MMINDKCNSMVNEPLSIISKNCIDCEKFQNT